MAGLAAVSGSSVTSQLQSFGSVLFEASQFVVAVSS